MTDHSAPTRGEEALRAECIQFVQEQSGGEWGEKIETEDALMLFNFVKRHRLAAIEECAKEAERFYQAYPRETPSDVTAWEIAQAIRNLGRGA